MASAENLYSSILGIQAHALLMSHHIVLSNITFYKAPLGGGGESCRNSNYIKLSAVSY